MLAFREPLRPAFAPGVRLWPGREIELPRAVLRKPLDLSPGGVEQPPLACVELVALVLIRRVVGIVIGHA